VLGVWQQAQGGSCQELHPEVTALYSTHQSNTEQYHSIAPTSELSTGVIALACQAHVRDQEALQQTQRDHQAALSAAHDSNKKLKLQVKTSLS
jgi:hypothetical protein